jgi:hypothetical protein
MIPSFQIIFGSSEVLKRWAEVQDILKLTKDGFFTVHCAVDFWEFHGPNSWGQGQN